MLRKILPTLLILATIGATLYAVTLDTGFVFNPYESYLEAHEALTRP